ncbi:Sterol 3-beta-glucosyltransferase UGT80A2 [Ceratocystis fimbriata CBS 114723]|uniref:Sterol 3-beta-glucosyltransferase UGT80A2 n=1 Tax=Ceratocystis fimbriata CBS 114723 TaxID=1035309 RepID=A0A2C5XHB5_9PEZI|nr:Sterol 3-beta-glucosyltransferase UGT80A2 [Ceratocystis fimbriata CBS 114723]
MGSKKELEAMGYNQPPADSRTNDSDDDGATVSSESAAPFQSYRPYSTLSMAPNDESPPAYAEINISNDAFSGAANITDDGRINVNINRASNFFAHFMSPAPNANPQHDPSDQPPAYIPEGLGFTSHNLPPPRLNIVIQIVGSRGDVQPFVALGKVLKNTFNHRVRIATHGTFQNFVEENGLEFFCIGGNPAELMAFMVKNPGLIPKRDTLRSGEISRRRKGIQEMVEGFWRSCFEPGDGTGEALRPHKKGESLEEGFELSGQPFVADVIIANPPSFAHIHIAEKLGIPLHMMFTMPWSPTRAFPHPLVNMQASGSMDNATANTVTYGLVEMFTWQGLADIINKFRVDVLELEALTVAWTPGILHRLQIPFTYCWSPALIPKPQDWGDHIDVSGFFMLDLASNYSPDQDLDAFLKAGPPPVYIGFGSIVVNDPDALTKLIFEAVRMAGVRALVSKGWGGLGGESLQVPDNVFMLGNCPHDWLFKHVSAVVHHGGAGTSSAGIHAGVPTAIVPFFGDQPFWGSMIARVGAGPPPIPFAKLTALKLAEALKVCGRPDVRLKAKELGAKICQENGTMQGAQSFHKQLDIGDLRCSLLPHRTAVWKVKRSKVKLCAMAAALLVRNGLLSWSDLKIYRSQEHNTVAEPWEPVSGFTANVINDIANVAYALADFHSGVSNSKKSAVAGSVASKSETSSIVSKRDLGYPSGESAYSKPGSDRYPPMLTHRATEPPPNSQSVAGPSSIKQMPSIPTLQPSDRSSTNMTTSSTSTTSTVSRDSGKMVSKTKEVGREAGKGVAKLIELGAMTPINMSIGMAKGFRNAPKLYNDPMVRESEKVKGIASGFKVAGKEFGYGIYDGVTGLVMQPYIGAQTGGKKGMVKGIAKGLGGFLLKPMGAFWALPAYGFQGAYMQLKGMGKKTYQAYIEASRVAQGEEDLRGISPADEKDILEGWKSVETGEGKKKSFWAASASSLTRPMTSGSSAPSYSSQPRTEEPPMPPMPRFPSERQPSRASTYDRFDDQRLGVHGSEPPASIAEDVSDAASVHSSRYMQHQSTGQSYQSYTYSDRGSSYSAAGPAGSVVSRSSTWRSEQPQFPSQAQAQAQPIPQQQNHIPQEPQELET